MRLAEEEKLRKEMSAKKAKEEAERKHQVSGEPLPVPPWPTQWARPCGPQLEHPDPPGQHLLSLGGDAQVKSLSWAGGPRGCSAPATKYSKCGLSTQRTQCSKHEMHTGS